MRKALLWLALVGLVAMVIALDIWFPPSSAYFRYRSAVRMETLLYVVASTAITAFVVRHYVVWSKRPSIGSPSAFVGPFHSMAPRVEEQWARLGAPRVGAVRYWPCAATLASGATIPRCVLVEENEFERHWRGQRMTRPAVRIEHVTSIESSPFELPAPILARCHDVSAQFGDDGRFLRFVFRDGRSAVLRMDEFPAIPEFPLGLDAVDVLDVLPENRPHGPVHESAAATMCVFSRGMSEGTA